MNLAIRGIEANLGPHHADSFHNDLHKTLKTDFLLANPPFNDSDWGGERLREDVRWKYGTPPAGNANFAWVQHFIHHLAPSGRGKTLCIDARQMGTMVDRTHRELTDEEIAKIAGTYHAWRTFGPHPASGHPLPRGEGRCEGASEALHSPLPLGEAGVRVTSIEMSWVFAKAQRSTRSASTDMCSPQVATSVHRRRRTTTNRSRKK